jgi:hypothetical protein
MLCSVWEHQPHGDVMPADTVVLCSIRGCRYQVMASAQALSACCYCSSNICGGGQHLVALVVVSLHQNVPVGGRDGVTVVPAGGVHYGIDSVQCHSRNESSSEQD